MTGPEHYKEAEEAIRASTYQRQEWGEGKGENFLDGAIWEMRRAQVHALLALAAATALPPAVAGQMMDDDCAAWTDVLEVLKANPLEDETERAPQ